MMCYSMHRVAGSPRALQLNKLRIECARNEVYYVTKFWIVINERFRGRNLNKGVELLDPFPG